jgi:hypothetical protein
MTSALQPHALDQLFRSARSYSEWTDIPVEESLVRRLYDCTT